jgi:phosphatidylethanolamine/phosphatidyl-N-methylethanolamine N-methyltransferase
MLDGLTLESGARIVELGPGTGAITGEIARRLPLHTHCVAIDIDPVFTARVAARWPQIDAVCDRAERLLEILRSRDLLPIDHIVSGLPFASLPGEATRAIVDAIAATLRPGGTFTTFQYLHAYALPPAIAVRRTLSTRLGSRPAFRVVMANLPPAFVIRWVNAPAPPRREHNTHRAKNN